MPHATARFLFEYRICGALAQLSERLFGDDGGRPVRSWAMRLDGTGTLIEVAHADDGPAFRETVDGWRAAGASYLFFDPFEPDEYTFVAWHRVPATVLERVLDLGFEVTDLVPPGGGEALESLPESHEVMF